MFTAVISAPLIASCVVVVGRVCTRCLKGLPVRKQAAGASARQCPICKAPTTLSRTFTLRAALA